MSLHNFNSNTKSWKMYTNTLTSISGDDLLVMPSYGKDLILEVSANNDIFFKKGTITKRFDNLVSDYLETSFNSLNSRVEYILQEISGASVKDFITSGISNDLLIKSYDGRDIILEVSGNNEIIFKRGDISYNLDDLIGGGGSSQNSDYAKYNILDITGKIIFTDNSNIDIEINNDASFNNVDVGGSLNVAGTVSASNIYTKSQVDASLANIYTKSQIDVSLSNIYTKSQVDASFSNVYTKSQVDASLANIYTKSQVDASLVNVYTKSQVDASLSNVYTKSQVDVSFVSKQLFDASLSSIQLSNVYTKTEVDVSFVSKQYFEASYNVLAASNGGGSGGYIQNNENISFDILNITDTIIFTDSSNVELYNDASFNNVDVNGSLNVAGTISASNIYTKSQVDVSFVSKQLFDASLSSIQLTNVYTKNQVDVSFISKQYFEASYNVLVSSIGTSGGTSTGTSTGTSGSSTLKFANNIWNKLGFDISGSGNDNLGSKIAISDDGTIIAVAVPNADTNGTDFGAVIIYKYINYNWEQLGNKIAVSPTATNGSYASELAISGNGTIIAFLYNYDTLEDIIEGGNVYPNEPVSYSVVKSFSYNNTVWIEYGSVSIASKNFSGNTYSPYSSMSLSRDGSTLAMGRWGTDANRGATFVYKFIDSSWNKYGPTIIPPFTGLAAGYKVSLSSNGNNIAISNWDGSSWPNTTLARAGSVLVYEYKNSTWNIMGDIIRGKKSYDQGHYIKLSGDGQILAIGAYGVDNYDNGLDSGAAYIYKYNAIDNSWNQLGQTIIPFAELHFEENTYTYFGVAIALSVDGNTIAITQQGYDGEIFTSPNAGRCIVYKYINNYWSQYGQYIPGFEYEGSSDIALSSDGTTLAYSSQNFKNGFGRVRVFGINNVSLSSSSSSSSNAYSKTEIDASFANVYTKSQVDASFANVYTKSQVDASFANVYTKSQVDASFANVYTKSQVDASFANIYTKTQVDVSFVSKQLFDASINALASGGGGGSSSTQYDNNIKILPDWVPIVEISNNLYTNLGYGDQVVFSKDGSTVATNAYEYIVPETTAKVGRAFIYHYNGTSWVQKGQPIDGKFNNFGYPIAMSLSSNGNVIALGYHKVYRHHDSLGVGVVIIYNYNMTTLLWEQLGNDIFSGRREEDIRHPPYMWFFGFANMGESLALSGDGTIIAIGAPNSSYMADYYNGVVVYKYETRNSVLDWYETSVILFVNFQIDIDIFGSFDVGHPNNFVYENFGKTIALSSDGTVIAVASPNEPKNDFPLIRSEPYHAGVVRTFKWNGIYWINTGRIVGEYEWDGDGEPNNSISLSANGNILAIGSLKNSARSSYNGSVRVYLWNNTDNSWNKLGDTFYGQGEVYGDGDESRIGNYVSLSDDGTIIAISSGSGSDITGVSEYKHGRVYKWDGTSWNRIGNAFHQGNTIALSGDGNYIAVANGGNAIETISIYDLQQNNIISINLTNLFFLDGSTYSYRKNDIKNSIFQINENSVHSEYYSDFPNKFTRTLYILQNGSLYNRNNTYGSFSDIRLKENIVDATPKLQDLLKVRVVNYNLKGSTNKQIGVIAQELEEIFPGLIETESSGEKYKSVKYSCINIMLVKGLQEQQVLINDMSSNINTLKDEITTLKQNMNSLLTRLQALEPNASQ